MNKAIYLLITIALLFGVSQASVAAAVPPPARMWFWFDMESVDKVEFVSCADTACEREISRSTITFWRNFVSGTHGPSSNPYGDKFGCSGYLCSVQYGSGDGIFYQLIATVNGVVYPSEIAELKRWDNSVVDWTAQVENGQLALQPTAEQSALWERQPRHNFWGTQQHFWWRWLLTAAVETLAIVGLFAYLGKRGPLPAKLIPMIFCVNLILYFVLALGIGSWRPLVSVGQRFFGVVSFIFAAIYLSFAYWFYAAEKPSMVAKIGAILVTTALLAVPGFFLMVIGGFASADHSFSGLPVEATIILAFIAAVVIDSCILLLYRAAAIPPEICLANQLGYERF